jgi:receptor protein-tyrosine kinase
MSRVDEAMRRAAARRQATAEGDPDLRPIEGADRPAVHLDPSQFPDESTLTAFGPVDVGAAPPEPIDPATLDVSLPEEPVRDADTMRPPEAPTPPVNTAASDTATVPPVTMRSAEIVPRLAPQLAEKVIVDSRVLPSSREQYRALAALLVDAQTESGTKVVMIASAVPAEGKTLTACNLALTLSESFQKRVLLIDGDLRRPTLHDMFRLNAASGLTDALSSPDERKLLIRQVSPRLAVLPAGRPDSDPMAILVSDRMRHLLDEAREAFDWVIIDTPPLVMLPDAHMLAPMADGVVLVVRAASTPHALVTRAIEAVGKARTIGVVLNQAESQNDGSYGGYYYEYAAAGMEAQAKK